MSNTDEIDILVRELRSEKIAIRQKAFSKLSSLCTIYRKTLNKIFERNDTDSDISYDGLFYSAHEGTKAQGLKLGDSDISEGDNRIKIYSTGLHDLLEASLHSKDTIKSLVIIQAATEILNHSILLKHFGNTYLSLLNTFLNSSPNLTSVQSDDWKGLLKALLKLLKLGISKFKFLFLIECTQKVVSAGCEYSYLALELIHLKVFDCIKTILSNRTSDNSLKERQEILVLTYYCCRDIAIDYRFELCKFLEEITEYICSAFLHDKHDKYRPFLFKLMDLSLIVHHPYFGRNDQNLGEYSHDRKKWNASLRAYESLLLEEFKPIKSVYRDKLPPKISSTTSEFAARFCYYVYWNDNIWRDEESTEDSELNPKRKKYTNKLQTVIERIKPPEDRPTNYNWKWLIVLCELISNYPASLQNDDVIEILKLLSESQPLIEFKEQIYAFTKCCAVLLEQEDQFKNTSNKIVYTYSQKLWMKISDEAARCCSNSNKNLIESHKLLQLLIYHNKYESNAFIEGVLKIFTSNLTVKCDTTLETLIVILKSFNLDSLPDGKLYTKQILKFAFEKITLAVLSRVIAGNEKPSYKILAQLAIFCCLHKTDVINYFKNFKINSTMFYEKIIDLEDQKEYKSYVDSIIHLMQLKTRAKLIIECEQIQNTPAEEFLDIPVELKCMISEDIFQELMKLTEIQEKVVSEESTVMEIKDHLKDVMANTELMMNLLSELLFIESTNQKKIENLFITKRIVLNIQEIERLFVLISEKNIEFDTSDTNKIVKALNSILQGNFHTAVGKLIRSYKLKNCLKWIYEQVDRNFITNEENLLKNKFNKKAFDNARIEYRLRYLLVTTLCEYFNYEGIDSEYVAELVDKIEFDKDDNGDLHTIFKIIEIFGQQKNVPDIAAVWIWEAGIIFICQNHKNNLYVMNNLIEKLSDLKKFTENHEDLRKHYATIYNSFSKLCSLDANSRRYFGPKIVAKYLNQFKHFHEVYFTIFSEPVIKNMYEKIYKEFLLSNSFEVKMLAVSALSTIFYTNCESDKPNDEQKIMNQSRKLLYKDFIESYEYVVNENIEMHNDEEMNNLATHVQLFVSIFCANFNFRRSTLFEIAKIFITFKLTESEGLDIYAKILKRLKFTYSKSLTNVNDIVDLISKWIELSMEMCKFPWYLIGCDSYLDFIHTHYNLILFSALKTREEVVDDFLTSVEMTLDVAAVPIISSCLALLIPSKANCTIRYEEYQKELDKKLRTVFSDKQLNVLLQENISEVIVKILENVIDSQKFLNMTGFQLDFCASYESIKFSDFEKCMNYIARMSKTPTALMTYLCQNKISQVQQIFMLQKKNIQGTESKEQKLLSFLHYNILINETIEYMNETDVSTSKSVKEYLSREIANFLCFVIVNKESGSKLSIMAADSLLSYLKNIIPSCSKHFKSQLQQIIPQLVAVCKNKNASSEKLKTKCFEVMNFLVLNQPSLREEIAVLDRFPLSSDFDSLRTKQLQIKYNDGDYALIEEIENFLEIKNRRIEGLTSLFENLSAQKSELKYLFEELRTMKEDKRKSTLHRLIRALISYIRGSDEERAIEAIKCLGEIGCHNISTIIFNAEESEQDVISQTFSNVLQCQRFICNKILEKLEHLMLHNNVNIFEVACEVCYYLLQSASSIEYKPSPIFNPFLPEYKSNKNLFYLEPKADKVLEMYKFISENNFLMYPQFMKGLCVNMTEFAGDKKLIFLIQTQLEFAEMIFPLIFHLLLLYNNEAVNNEILKTISYYFEQCFEKLNYSEHTNEGSIFINKNIMRQMLKLMEKIRIYCQDHRGSKIASMQNFNYLQIAKAAKHCEASFTAIQYCEMWARKQQEENNVDFSVSIKDKTLQDIMYRSYSEIGINEASEIYLDPLTNRTEYLLQRNMNFQCLLEVSNDAPFEDYMKLLNDIGLHHIANKFNENLESSKKLENYESLWKLCKWNTVVETDTEIRDNKGSVDYKKEFEKYHYLSLQYSNNNDQVGLNNALFKSRKIILHLINHHILECSNTLYNFLEMSHRLAQIGDFSEVLFKRTVNTHELLLEKWKIHNQLPFNYDHCKKIFLQRNSILSTANIKAGKRTWVPDAIQSNSLFLVKQSVLAGQYNDVIKLITQLRDDITSVPRKMEFLIEEAKLNIDKNQELAKMCLNQVMTSNQITNDDLIIQSTAYRLYGEILAENFSEEVPEIFKKYFEKSMKMLEKFAQYHQKTYLIAKLDDEEELSQFSQSLFQEEKDSSVDAKIRQASCIYDTIARYYDREYEFKNSYITSPDFVQNKTTYIKNSERLKMLANIKIADIETKKSIIILKKSTDLDGIHITNAEKERKNAARNAIYYYVRSTIYSMDDNILNIFRIVSLMLANMKSEFYQKFLNENLLKIPSYKFVVALPQLTVRLNEKKTDVLNVLLKKLLTRCALDHPHQTLPLILSLVNSYADLNCDSGNEPRVIGAKDLWMTLKKYKEMNEIMKQMEQMSSALIHLANLPLKTNFIPPDHKVLKLTDLSKIQCPTIDLPVVKNAFYKSLITVEKWDTEVKPVGGINAPKRIEVLCSDGIKRPQLLKGKDDMRQDAIMQQIFGVVNKLLLLDKNMQKYQARIRTYKVVPFSRRSGILEWCENTIPIGSYLVGERDRYGKIVKKGAHEIYRPQDWKPSECLQKISDMSKLLSDDDILRKFNEICQNIKPVFHNFFNEKFQNTGEHFERRLTYTNSVAVSSMIGYILGIGDRHVQNILVDLKTAEFIHIDFGVAFEQGKILPHPELIPFRLTRDIIAPFGISGVDGIFRKTCESTINILRRNEKTLTTILEVLLYDPMYTWSVGANQARRLQLGDEDNAETSAEENVEHDLMASRALNCVKMKLKGMAENSTVCYPSIEGQVQYLIQAATNPLYLSRLFRGWQAYL